MYTHNGFASDIKKSERGTMKKIKYFSLHFQQLEANTSDTNGQQNQYKGDEIQRKKP